MKRGDISQHYRFISDEVHGINQYDLKDCVAIFRPKIVFKSVPMSNEILLKISL